MVLDAPVNIVVGGRLAGKTRLAVEWAKTRGLPVVAIAPPRLYELALLKTLKDHNIHPIKGSETSFRGLGEFSLIVDECDYLLYRQINTVFTNMRWAKYVLFTGTLRRQRRVSLLRHMIGFARRKFFPVVILPSAWGVPWKELERLRMNMNATLYKQEWGGSWD